MTIQIPLSQIGSAESFVQAVESFWQAKLAHRFTVDVPAPTADPRVESVVRRVQGREWMLALGRKTAHEKVASFLLMMVGRSIRLQEATASRLSIFRFRAPKLATFSA